MQPFAFAASIALACAAPAGSCPVTQTDGGIFGNDFLQAGVPPDGKFVFKPGGAGFVDRDGALGIKFGWNRLVPGRLQVGGRRLDGDEGFQPTYQVFPTPGCWEITGGVGEARLSFIVFVERIGAGPDWRFQGPHRGWRVTNSPEKAP